MQAIDDERKSGFLAQARISGKVFRAMAARCQMIVAIAEPAARCTGRSGDRVAVRSCENGRDGSPAARILAATLWPNRAGGATNAQGRRAPRVTLPPPAWARYYAPVLAHGGPPGAAAGSSDELVLPARRILPEPPRFDIP